MKGNTMTLHRDTENLVDCLFTHLKLHGYAPNRQWIKQVVIDMDVKCGQEFTKKLSEKKNPVDAFDEAYNKYERHYFDFVASMSYEKRFA